MPKFIDRAGETRGKLTAISGTRGSRVKWFCVCECGRFTTILASTFTNGKHHSCGECRDYAFGDGKKNPTFFPVSWRPTLESWRSMINRCYSRRASSWDHYGGRGIIVCDRWLNSFSAFVDDMGLRPSGMSIDRIDVNGHYCLENCRWLTPEGQARNTRKTRFLTAYGSTRMLREWSAITGVGTTTIRERLCRGWSPEDAVSVPPLKKGLEIRYNVAERRPLGERIDRQKRAPARETVRVKIDA